MMIRTLFCLMALFHGAAAFASSEFTYQGHLMQDSEPFDGSANFEFRLYASSDGSDLVGEELRLGWPVHDGLFQVDLDFGPAAFSDGPRYLEVRVNGTPLGPRQVVRPAPVALFALDGNPGPPGPQGEQGPPGPGPTKVTFPGHDFAASANAFLTIPDLGPQIDDVMIWVYLVDTEFNLIYPIPGKGNGANSDYRVWWLRSGSSISVRIQRYGGPGEFYGEIRVFIVPVSG